MRIKVDFSEFFDDERKLSVVNVNTQEAATVNDVLHKIMRVFKLTPTPHKRRRGGNTPNKKLEFGLFEEGFYVPPEETSTVLQDVGILKLKPLSNVNEEIVQRKKKKHKIQKTEEEEGGGGEEEEHLENDDENPVKKRRRSKRNKDEVEEIIKESRKSKRNKGEAEEIIKEGRKNKRNKDEAEEIVKEGRKSKRNKDEAEEIIKEGRKSKRHGVDVEENNRGRKGRRRKKSVETDADEEEEEDAENVDDYKKEKRQNGKKSRFRAKTSDAESSNEEQSKKTKRKDKPHTESDSEVEERKSKRKSKKDSVQNTTSLTLTEEFKDTPLKNKKLKNDKIKQEEECLSETETKQTESESALVPETKSRKSTRQSVIEINEASAVRDCKNLDKYEEKRSQEKEISTSNVIHVESDEACQSSSGSDGNSEKMDIEQDLAKDSDAVSSIADGSHMLDVPKAKRRRRKHKKGNKQHPQNEDETEFPNQNYTSKTSHNVNVSSENFEREDHPMKFQHKNADVSTSSTGMGSHTLFKSDDEEEVTSASNSGDGNDIEIIGTASRTDNKRYCGTGPQLGSRGRNARTPIQKYPSGNLLHHSTPRSQRSKPSIIEIEGDETINKNVEDSALCGYANESFHSSYVQKSRSFNYDNMATLRKMCENKTITIVNVNTSTNKLTSEPVRIPSPVSHMRRGPPLPGFQSPNKISEAEFYNIMALQNRTLPLVVRTSREALVESIEDVDDSDVSSEPENSEISRETESIEVPVQTSFSPNTHNAFQEKTDKDSLELLSIPSTSGYIESCTTSVDKPGPSTKNSRKAAPRSYEAIGAVLSNLRIPQDSCEESETDELHMDIPSSPEEIDDEDKDTEAYPSSPEEIKEEKDTEAIPSSPEEIKLEKDKDVASTQGEATTMDEIVFAETLNIKGENEENNKGIEVLNVQKENEEKTKGNSPSEPAPVDSETDPLLSAASYDTDENRQLMKEMITETLKEDLLKDLKKEVVDGEEEDDSRFLKFPLMKTLPKVGEYLAVKVLSLDEKLRPVHSNYIQVQVQDVSGLNVRLKTVSNLKSKYINKEKDEDVVEEIDLTFEEEVDLTADDRPGEVMELDWRDVHEPRHLFP